MRRIEVVYILVFMLLNGCGVELYLENERESPPDVISESSLRHHTWYPQFQNRWIGKNVTELISELGNPDFVLEATPKGVQFRSGIHVDSYIYRPEPESDKQCMQTYVVVFMTGEIIKYYCR
jgi:hypothetical protein